MTLRSARSRRSAVFAGAFALLASAGCSFFYNLNTTQCEVNADCPALGAQFANTQCVNRVCVPNPSTSGGAAQNGGSGGVSGTSQGGTNPQGGGAGEAAGGQPECLTNGDCIDAHVDQPYICQDQKCLALTNSDCPVLLPTNKGLDYLRTPSPLILGGYASMTNAQDPHDTQAIINWDLAFDEFNTQTLGGFPSSDGSRTLRPVVQLVCQGKLDTTDQLTPSMTHLTQEVRVPGILSTLAPDFLYTAFNFTQSTDYVKGGYPPVFFLSTGSADLRLANLQDNGLMWHMLGDPRVLAATSVGLLEKIEPYVNAQRAAYASANGGNDDPTTVPLRVTLVYSDDPTMTDIATVLTTPDSNHPEALLQFNGKSVLDNGANFRQVQIQSAKLHSPPDVSAGITDLETNPPHVIIAMATSEFASNVIPALETFWGKTSGDPTTKQQRPYYLMSHFLYNTQQVTGVAPTFASKTPPLAQRIVGVNYAAAQDAHSKQLYTSYEGRLVSSYQGTLTLDGTENYYDGAYSLIYALAAANANNTNPTGTYIRDGLEDRVFSVSSGVVSVDIGPSPIGATIGKFSDFTYHMALWGTDGPPNFDRLSGTRVSPTSAWCIQPKSGMPSTYEYEADGLIYNTSDQTFSAPATGVPTCLQQYN